MADAAISALTEITAAASGDLLAIVDVSDTTQSPDGTTRGISTTNLLKGASPVTVAANDTTSEIGADHLCDGSNDEVTIQTAIDAVSAQGGGIVLLLEGTYTIQAEIKLKANVSLRGEGWGTVLTGSGSTAFSILSYDSATISGAAPLADVEIRDLKIDGSSMTQASFDATRKGIFCKGCLRWLIDNVWVTGTLATGIGTDHMKDCRISNCLVTNCGRGISDANSEYGGNGIGIGVGDQTDESLTIANCHVRDIGNNGIMFEVQDNTHVFGDYLVENCFIEGCARGLRFSAVKNVKVLNTVVRGSTKQGALFSDAPTFASTTVVTSDVTIADCTFDANTGDAIAFSGGNTGDEPDSHYYEDVLIQDNLIRDNGGDGVSIRAVTGQTASRIVVAGNHITGNTGNAIVLLGTLDDTVIRDNYLAGNTGGTISDSATDTGTVIRNNYGHNPQGPASVTVSASPFTYTAGPTPENVYIRAGTVSDISKGGTTLLVASPATVRLEPNESVVVTYSSAPTMVKDRL